MRRARIAPAVMAALSAAVFMTMAATAPAHHIASLSFAHDSHEVISPAAPIPGESLYQLQMDLTTHDGRKVALAELGGQPVLITMFYSSCGGVCPTLAFTIRRME